MSDAVIDEIDGRRIRIGEKWLADFASCNYLGFDLEREIIEAVPAYLEKWVGLLRPLRSSRDFRVLWAGMTVSLVGDGIFLIAVAWTAFKLWNAPGALSVIGIAMTVPTIICLLAGGAISDRFDRRLVLVCSDLARALAVALLAGLAYAGELSFAALALLAAAVEVTHDESVAVAEV
jgi:hypothetical protein